MGDVVMWSEVWSEAKKRWPKHDYENFREWRRRVMTNLLEERVNAIEDPAAKDAFVILTRLLDLNSTN